MVNQLFHYTHDSECQTQIDQSIQRVSRGGILKVLLCSRKKIVRYKRFRTTRTFRQTVQLRRGQAGRLKFKLIAHW